MSKKSVLNLGQSGNGPLFEFATLREYLNPNIKKVLWIYYENDLINLEEEKKNTFLINYLNDLSFTQNLKLKQNEIDNLLLQKINEILGNVERARLIYKILSYLTIHNTRKLIFTPPTPMEDFKKIIQLTKKLLKKNNTKLYFVYLPEYSRYLTNFNDSNFKKVKNIINELNIPFLDIHQEVFDKEQNPLKNLFSSTGHYNVEGYKKVAKQIYKFTKD